MAVFTSTAMSMRRELIKNALRKAGAVSPETAKKLPETDLINPDSFQEYTSQLAEMGIIHRTADGKYYVLAHPAGQNESKGCRRE